MRRRSQEFEDEVFEAEQRFSIENQRQRQINEINEETTKMKENITLLQKKNKEIESKLLDVGRIIREIMEVRENMLTALDILTQGNKLY